MPITAYQSILTTSRKLSSKVIKCLCFRRNLRVEEFYFFDRRLACQE